MHELVTVQSQYDHVTTEMSIFSEIVVTVRYVSVSHSHEAILLQTTNISISRIISDVLYVLSFLSNPCRYIVND